MGLQFDPIEHKYRYEGRLVPGVTTVLGRLQDFSKIPPAVLARKSALGTAVHRACELVNLDDLDERSLHAEVAPYVVQYKRFLQESGFEVVLTEQRVHSKKYGYAGTLDLWGFLHKKKTLIDIKTACLISPVYGPQLAAYAAALEEEQGHKTEKRFVLRLSQERYWLEPMTEHDDLHTFYAELHSYNWRLRHGI